MTKRELKKDPNTDPDELWDKWELWKARDLERENRTKVFRGYYDMFQKTKKRLTKEGMNNENGILERSREEIGAHVEPTLPCE